MTASLLCHQDYDGTPWAYDHHPFGGVIAIASAEALSDSVRIVAASPRGVLELLRILEKREYGPAAGSDGLIETITGGHFQKLGEAKDD